MATERKPTPRQRRVISRGKHPCPRDICLDDTTCRTCANGYALNSTLCVLQAPTPVASLPDGLTTPASLFLSVPMTGLDAADAAAMTVRYVIQTWQGIFAFHCPDCS